LKRCRDRFRLPDEQVNGSGGRAGYHSDAKLSQRRFV